MRLPIDVPRRKHLKADGAAGLTVGIASVPDGMAASVLAGVNPVHGLYASMAGSIVGGLTARTQLMVVTTTSAAALAAGEALSGLSGEERTAALALLVVLAGGLQVAAGLLRLGRFTRFVSHSVMKAFLLGIAVLIVLRQLPVLAGADVEGDNTLERPFDLLMHPGQIHLPSLTVGLAALVFVVGLSRTRLSALAALAAVAIPSFVVWALDAGGVDVVGDVPSGLPTPELPALSAFSLDLLTGAAALAAIVLVQGAGVAQSVRRPTHRRMRISAPRVTRTSPPVSCAASWRAARSARPRSTSAPGRARGGLPWPRGSAFRGHADRGRVDRARPRGRRSVARRFIPSGR
jgi:sulfate permease, SulP family